MSSYQRDRHRLSMGALFVIVIVAWAGVARSQEGILGGLRRLFGGQREAAEQAEPAAEVVNQFTPHLKTILTAEIHFLRKLCRPDAEQLEHIRKAGMEAVNATAQEFARLQQGGRHSGFPDARERLAAALQKEIDEVMPEEAARQYREEIAARAEARREAVAGMMTMLIDRELSLSPEQFEQVEAAANDNWNDQWGRNLQVFLYDQYAPMPPDNVLKPLLNERQQAVWGQRTHRGGISFGWEGDLGLNWMGGAGQNLKELDEYPDEPEQPKQAEPKQTEEVQQ